MRVLKGEYTTRRDGGVTYGYEASWHMRESDWIAWTFEARSGGRLAGRSSGHVMRPAGADVDAFIRELVCEAIEHRRMFRAEEQ